MPVCKGGYAMKSRNAKKIAAAIFLVLFAVLLLLFIAVLWGLIKAPCVQKFTDFITGGNVFLRIIIGIGVLAILVLEVYVFIFSGREEKRKLKSPMNLVGKNDTGTAYISSAAIDAMIKQCIKKRNEVKDSVNVIAPGEGGGVLIELKLKIFKDTNLPMLCASLQQEVKTYIEQQAGIPVRGITVSVIDIIDDHAAAAEKRVK